MPDETAQAANLLWTGGWDSTYRLLDLVLVQGRAVQPYYFPDPVRASRQVELRTMETIKAEVARRRPDAGALIGDTIVIEAQDIPADPVIDEQYERLRAAAYIGRQYASLARMAKHHGLSRLELSVHVDDKLYDHLRGNIAERDGIHALVDTPATADLEMFRPFVFPILRLTKIDMGARAAAAGFADLMEQTWFCHAPDRKGRACGICNPCVYTIEEGLARRVPWQNRVRYHARRVASPATSFLARHRVRHRLKKLLRRGSRR